MEQSKTVKSAKTVKSDTFEYIKSSHGIKEYKLKKNGLSVLLMQDTSAPVVNVMVTYMVGSRNEAVGHTGSTHLLEHLLFKGSKKFNKQNKKEIWRLLEARGARMNATTWLDRTNYYELLPNDHIETALAIEADRMRNAFITEADRQTEMTVVRNEYEMHENEPLDVLDTQMWAMSYLAHPYHHPTIGWRSDIENVSIERLKEFYDTYYWPNNAVLSIIGDFNVEQVLAQINKLFGAHRSSPHKIPQVYTTEPPQLGLRRFSISRAGDMRIVGIAHKSPPGLHTDSIAMQILAQIIGLGRTSRFYKNLVETGLAIDCDISTFPFRDSSLFATYVIMSPKVKHAEIEKRVLAIYKNVIDKGVTTDELEKAKTQIQTATAMSRDGAFAMASALNEAISLGDWTYYSTFNDRVKDITVADISAVAKKYLIDSQCTVGYFIPTKIPSRKSEEITGVHEPINKKSK